MTKLFIEQPRLHLVCLKKLDHANIQQNSSRNQWFQTSKAESSFDHSEQGLLPGQVAVCRHRTVTPYHGLANPVSSIEASLSAGSLVRRLEAGRKDGDIGGQN